MLQETVEAMYLTEPLRDQISRFALIGKQHHLSSRASIRGKGVD
jgi:hypothetical protein